MDTKKMEYKKRIFNIKRQYEFDGLSVENHAEHGYRINPLKGVLESPLSIQLRQKFIKSYSLLCVRFSTSFAFIYSKKWFGCLVLCECFCLACVFHIFFSCVRLYISGK